MPYSLDLFHNQATPRLRPGYERGLLYATRPFILEYKVWEPCMHYNLSLTDDTVTLQLQGALTFQYYGFFRNLLTELALHADKSCVLDLSNVDLIDSAGVGMMLMIHDRYQFPNQSKTIFQGTPDHIRAMLSDTGLHQVFNFED